MGPAAFMGLHFVILATPSERASLASFQDTLQVYLSWPHLCSSLNKVPLPGDAVLLSSSPGSCTCPLTEPKDGPHFA